MLLFGRWDSSRLQGCSFGACHWLAILLGMLFIVVYSFQSDSSSQRLAVLAIGFMTACACLLSGGLVGFLFGIPRTLQQEAPSPQSPGTSASGAEERKTAYGENTNLEQISDWLTKILVGVGLTQLNEIQGKMILLTNYVASGMGSLQGAKAFVMATIVYFTITGFLVGYLLTRLCLKGALAEADRALLDALSKQVDQTQRDLKALRLAQKQLNLAVGQTPVPQEELVAALREASPDSRADIFYRAKKVRADNWRQPETKPKMELTIPVFRALIATDPEERYHRNHGQLGFALKDAAKPAWEEAEKELTKAMEIRDKLGIQWSGIYEFNRAVCRIALDPEFSRDEPSKEGQRELIAADLRLTAATDLNSLLEKEVSVRKWLKLNNVNLAAT